MTRVDFYLLSDGPGDARYLAVCRLTDKAFRLGHRIYIHTADAAEAGNLDRLLWTFSAGSFVPHGLTSEPTATPLPVRIGPEPPPDDFGDVLISLASQVPDFFQRFARVAEVVGPTEDDKRQARDRFRFYREHGTPPQTHTL